MHRKYVTYIFRRAHTSSDNRMPCLIWARLSFASKIARRKNLRTCAQKMQTSHLSAFGNIMWRLVRNVRRATEFTLRKRLEAPVAPGRSLDTPRAHALFAHLRERGTTTRREGALFFRRRAQPDAFIVADGGRKPRRSRGDPYRCAKSNIDQTLVML